MQFAIDSVRSAPLLRLGFLLGDNDTLGHPMDQNKHGTSPNTTKQNVVKLNRNEAESNGVECRAGWFMWCFYVY